jgi:hypothetical protein
VQPDGAFTLATPHHVSIDAAEKAQITTKDTFTLTATGTTRLTTKPQSSGDASGGGTEGTAAPPGEIQLDAKGALTLSSDAASSLSAGTSATLSAKSGLTVSGGEQVKVQADGSIAISGATISISATGTVTISGSEIVLG